MSEGPILVVCPAILRFSWAEEIERWLPSCLPSEIHLGIGFLPLSFYFYSCFCFASFLLGWVLEVGRAGSDEALDRVRILEDSNGLLS